MAASRLAVLLVGGICLARVATGAPDSAPNPDYAREAQKYAATAEDQFRLALWCLEKGHMAEYRAQLARVIELDPDHEDARKRLGYRKWNDQWLTRDEFWEAQGYVKYRGRYVLPQEKDAQDAAAARDEKRKEIIRKIRMWQGWLDDSKRRDRARGELMALREPEAVQPLLSIFGGDDATVAERELLVEVLGGILGPESTEALVQSALVDESAKVRARATESLRSRKSPSLIQGIVRYLEDNDNRRVRNAAVILGEIGDPSVVPALIDALVTTHTRIHDPSVSEMVQEAFGSYQPRRTIVLPDGSMVSVRQQPRRPGSTGPRRIIEEHRNTEVLKALIAQTEVNFGYDKDAWLQWMKEAYRKNAAKIAP